VSMCGYAGLLAGPPLIGAVANGLTLRGGLAVVAATSLVIVVLARVLQRGPLGARMPETTAAEEPMEYEVPAQSAA